MGFIMTNSNEQAAAKVIGARIKRLRRDRELTLEDLANKAGTCKSVICSIEKGRQNRPSYNMLQRLAAALGTTTQFIGEGTYCLTREEWQDIQFHKNYMSLGVDDKEKVQQLVKLWAKK